MSEITCCDCFWYIGSGAYEKRCEKHGRKRVAFDDPICSDFLSDDTPSCGDCTYFEPGAFTAKCTLKNKKMKNLVMSPPACPSFVEG